MLRSDYDPVGHGFSNASVYPAYEVEVCPWWSPTLVKDGAIANVTVGSATYTLCSLSASSPDNLTLWPTYVFVSNANSLSVSNLDLFLFVRYIHQSVAPLAGYYVTGAYFGYRLYTGKGNFAYASEPKLVAANIPLPPPPPPPPIPTPIPTPVPTTPTVIVSCPFSTLNVTG